jgi:hypothetical protein
MRNIDTAALCIITATLFASLYVAVSASLQPQLIVSEDSYNDDCPCLVGGITNQTINWKTTPNMRGTFSIISSCILTLAISMWSAIHLNIPSQSRAKWQWVEKFTYLIGGVLWPEIIAFIALEQNIAAGESSKAIAQTLKLQRESILSAQSKHHSSQIGEPGWRRLVGMFRASKHTDIEVSMISPPIPLLSN